MHPLLLLLHPLPPKHRSNLSIAKKNHRKVVFFRLLKADLFQIVSENFHDRLGCIRKLGSTQFIQHRYSSFIP